MIRRLSILILISFSISVFGQGKISRIAPTSNKPATKLSISGSVSGHDYVDLGLPSGSLWATCNIGSTIPSSYGEYFAWAEIAPKDEYSIFTNKSNKWLFRDLKDDVEKRLYTKAPINCIIGVPEYDAATANWGSGWRLPSKKDFEELVAKCKWQIITFEGNKGFMVTGPNGNKLFLPFAGYMENAGSSQLKCEGIHGIYWTGDYNDSSSNETLSYAFGLYHPQYNKGVTPHNRYSGHSIRPICKSKNR